MKIIKEIILCTGLFTLISCQQESELKIEKYSNGNIKSKINYINDTIKHGIAKLYYLDSKLKDEIYYNNGKKDGIHKHYFPSGQLEAEISFQNGKQEGFTFWYHENGILQSNSYWVDGKEYGSASFYYDNGNLERYQCRDFFENVIYLVRLNEKGEKIKEEGMVFSHFVNIYPKDTSNIKVNDQVIFKITVPEPPDFRPKIWIREIYLGDTTNRTNVSVKNSTVVVKRTFDRPGKYGLIIVGELVDNDNNLILSDSVVNMISIN